VINEREVKAPNPPAAPAPPAPPAPRSIVEIASGNPAFSTLVGALQAADLVGTLSGAGPFTVFAPTNDAFAKLSSVPGGDALKNVLLYHVAWGRFDAASLLRSGEATTLQGQKVRVRQMGNAVMLNDNVMVTSANIQASNGIIHVIDTVLIPPLPSILEIAASTPALSTLVSAVQSAGLVGALSGNGPYTVFAPTNDAFGRLSSVPSGDALRTVLTYHVASGRFSAAQLTELARRHGTVRTLQGAIIQLSLDHSGNLLLNGNVRVITANINASNGIVHVIDRVLIPPSH
jgi:transforming growth factor-beta-induced protein